MARGASFDRDLEEKIGEVIGAEVRAVGGNYYGGVCINLPRIHAGAVRRSATEKIPIIWEKWGQL